MTAKEIEYHTYVDTNVLVDYYTGQADAIACLKYLYSTIRKEHLFTSALALVQTASQLQKKNTQSKRRAATKQETVDYLEFLFSKFTLLELNQNDLTDSFAVAGSDIEDNVHYVLSRKKKCRRIITRNIRDFSKYTRVEVLSPNNIALIKRKIK